MPYFRAWTAPAFDTREAHPTATTLVVLGALLGAAIVIVSQFTALYDVHVATSSVPVKTIGTGANHAWAPIPLAALAAVLALAVYRSASRMAMVALAALGIATLLIGLLGDLPDVHATGLVGSSANQYVQGAASPSAGLYIETLGAVLLLVSGGVGFLMLAAPAAGGEPAPPGGEPAPPGAPRRSPTTPAA